MLDGPINRDTFIAYVRKVLVPDRSPDDIVIIDNLSSHKAPAGRGAIEAAGASLPLLPPYSPNFNPIEQVFSKLNAHLRRVLRQPDIDGIDQPRVVDHNQDVIV